MNQVVVIKEDFNSMPYTTLGILEDKMSKEIASQNAAGYEVVTVTPITASSHDSLQEGFESYTCGVVIVFKEIN